MAAGHGLFGITIAQRNPQAHITALDWPNVLAVASENATKFGVADRHSLLAGDAFAVEFGGPFLPHFDPPTCEKLMRKIRAALIPDGQCVTLDFVAQEDRVSPPTAAAFALMMLATTPAGDAYTFTNPTPCFGMLGLLSPGFLY